MSSRTKKEKNQHFFLQDKNILKKISPYSSLKEDFLWISLSKEKVGVFSFFHRINYPVYNTLRNGGSL